MMRAVLIALLLAAAVAMVGGGGCLKRPTFECSMAAECTSANGGGFCVSGFCAFTDVSCASGQRYGENSGALAGQCVPQAGDDAPPDVPPDQPVIPPDARECFGTGLYTVCIAGGPTGTIDLAAPIDTDTDVNCLATQPTDWIAAGQSPACFIVGDQITVSATVVVTGSRPLVLLGNTITVNARLDGASHRGQPTGPGASTAICGAFATNATDTTPSAGGGAGGTFITTGGNGGRADNNGGKLGGTVAPLIPAPTLLRGGCPGQVGGDATAVGGVPGGGGGTIALIAGAITISNAGRINVSGAAGSPTTGGGGGGGAGSGGMIVLIAEAITATGARLSANGGGGASGSADNNGAGEAGNEPNPDSPQSSASGGNNTGGDGGRGFAQNGGMLIPATGGGTGNNQAGGGGGGGGGYIQSSIALAGATVSPAAIIVP